MCLAQGLLIGMAAELNCHLFGCKLTRFHSIHKSVSSSYSSQYIFTNVSLAQPQVREMCLGLSHTHRDNRMLVFETPDITFLCVCCP